MYIGIFPCQILFLINRFCFKCSSVFNMEFIVIYKCLLFQLMESQNINIQYWYIINISHVMEYLFMTIDLIAVWPQKWNGWLLSLFRGPAQKNKKKKKSIWRPSCRPMKEECNKFRKKADAYLLFESKLMLILIHYFFLLLKNIY